MQEVLVKKKLSVLIGDYCVMAMILLPQSLVLTVNSLIYKTRAKRELGYISAYCIKFTINSFDSE